jgi:ABC-type Fe3+/spermidine/putrescine transport system ATPase subunit
MRADVLELRDLSVRYGGSPALSDVHLRLAPGEMLALLGPSGSGKSTLLHTVAGFNAPHTGEVWLDGVRVATPAHAEPPERRGVAMVFQNYALWPHLNALDTVAYPARRRGVSRARARREALAILERLQVAHLAHRHPSELSGGEQQRVGLARALARDASVYLFDEPTAHLDTHVRAMFLHELLRRRRDTGAAALYATHDAEEALGVADRVALLAGGRVVQVGTPEEVYHRPVDLWAARLTGPASMLDTTAGRVLVRPDWACLGGDRTARVSEVWFRGPHSDYLLETGRGDLLLREPGRPRHVRGDRVGWTLRQSWPLADTSVPAAQPSSRAAGPE